MQIDESRKLLLSDTLVPDIFITEYLPALEGLAVKVYIYLLLTARTSHSIGDADLARRMGTDIEQIKVAVLALAAANLVVIHEKSLEIVDIKAQEIDKAYRPRTASTPVEALDNQAQFTVREKLMADIAKTFFQGLMSPSWYAEIDNWFERYHFEPEVIYALFQECARRNKLDSKAYISKVAENWASRGITTFQGLNAYFLAYNKVSKACQKIGRKLRKTMTEYDEEIVGRWIEKMDYDFDIIELALRKTVKLANPNLEFIDKILQEWFAHQLRDAEQIRTYETEKAARLATERSRRGSDKGAASQASGSGTPDSTGPAAESGAASPGDKTGSSRSRGGQAAGSRRPANFGNFSQREYSDDYLAGFFEEVPLVDDRPARPGSGDAGSPVAPLEGQIDIAEMLRRQENGRSR